MAKCCDTVETESWDLMWGYFDKGKGVVSVQAIVDVWRKYYME